MGVPQNGLFIRENPIEMDDLGIPPCMDTTILKTCCWWCWCQWTLVPLVPPGTPLRATQVSLFWAVSPRVREASKVMARDELFRARPGGYFRWRFSSTFSWTFWVSSHCLSRWKGSEWQNGLPHIHKTWRESASSPWRKHHPHNSYILNHFS